MEHTRLKPMEGISGREKTAFTMKTIQELLAEEVSSDAGAPAADAPAPESGLQQPPHMTNAAPVEPAAKPALRTTTAPAVEAERTMPPMPLPPIAKADALPTIAPATEEPKPRSLFGRLIGS
jgi:hypothetical protein